MFVYINLQEFSQNFFSFTVYICVSVDFAIAISNLLQSQSFRHVNALWDFICVTKQCDINCHRDAI